ncbi:MAG: xanthine dehydrogenase molybdopterin binding subunit [Roseibacillus sp.]
MPATITINGKVTDVSAAPLHQNLLEFLRLNGFTGSKVGCNEGDCGACTLLLLEPAGPPRAINGCLALVHSLIGREVLTAEGLAANKELHPAQSAMVTCNGSQCGYCTPGFICSMAEGSARGIQDDPAAIADQLCGNLCRCTGYRPIREAAALIPQTDLPSSEPIVPDATDKYYCPTTIAEVFVAKSHHPKAPYIAGATELAVLMNKRHLRPDTLISLEHVTELLELKESDTHWHIGAACPLTDLEPVAAEYPAFGKMLRLFASRQIRHRATLGGNLVTASPIGDSAPVLLALDATVTLQCPHHKRTIPLSEFFTGYRATVLKKDELLVTINVPRKLTGVSAFSKVSKRREMDISTVSLASRILIDDSGVIQEARLAFGGVSAHPARAYEAEKALIGQFGKTLPSELPNILSQEFTPLSDQRGSAEYRQRLILSLCEKHLAALQNPELLEIEIPVPELEAPTQLSDPHESAVGHVTGHALYTHDIGLNRNALHAYPVFSQVAHATIDKLDVTPALTQPGVQTILTAEDITGSNNTGPARHDEPLFATDTIQYHGQLLAAVIADSYENARLAAEKIIIETIPLPPLLGIPAAVEAESFHTDPHILGRGDVEQGLKDAPHQLSGTLEVGGQEQFYLETHAAFAEPDGEDAVLIHSSTQHPSETQTIVAEVLGWARHRVTVESPRMGGGFGGKETQANPWAAVCALAAHQLNKPVTLQLDRDHDMVTSGKRHPFHARFQVGYHDDGRIDAVQVHLFSDGGWSLDLSQPVNDRALFHLDNAYYFPNVHFEGRVCKTNATSHTAFRGFGGPQGMVIIEDILARVALALDLPPEQVRACNFYHGDGETNTTHYGEVVEGNRIQRIWDELLESSDFTARKKELHTWNQSHPQQRRGLAITPVKFGISFTLKHYNQAGALVLIYADGSVQVNHGGTEMGQGLHSKILTVAMKELGLSADRIRLMNTRTDKVPNTSATAASSGSDLNGMAVADACRQLRERLAPLAAQKLECDPSEVIFTDDSVHAGHHSLPFDELAQAAYAERIQLSAAGFYKTPDLEWDWSMERPKGRPFHYYAFGAAVSEVEVDGYTGMHHLRRVDILHDVGNSLSPDLDRGQIEGAFVQGAGWLTSEDLQWNDDGVLLTHSASTYAIPAFSDAPLDFRVNLLTDAAQDSTIHGSKAVGEPPLMLAISVREALRDALCNNTDIPSPLTPEVILTSGGVAFTAAH